MIPKTIHYCWFGPAKKSDEILKCIESWKKTCPDFSIIEWNEENFPVEQFPFTRRMYIERKWAFVADYVRLYTLSLYGGFYLDTDMLLIQSLEPLTKNKCVLGKESEKIISAGMIGAEAHHPFIEECKKFYDESKAELITIPRVLTQIYENFQDKESLTVYPAKVFYPFDSEHIKEYYGQSLDKEVMGVHLWNYSWGSPLNKFFKKIGIYSFGKKITEKLGIKIFLKKLFKFT